MSEALLKSLKEKMDRALEALHKDFTGLRTGRASISLLEPVQVNAYGALMPLNQVGTIGVPESRLITVQVWDTELVPMVEKAIREAEIGVNPITEGQLIRIPLPDLSEERRQELVKIANKYAEQSRISIRNIRRDGMDVLKKQEKDNEISESNFVVSFMLIFVRPKKVG